METFDIPVLEYGHEKNKFFSYFKGNIKISLLYIQL
jgi:hypothetical protein